MTSSPEKDINEIFEDLLLTEENISKTGYEEGFQEGVQQGNTEGYQLGYAKGAELGDELGSYYGLALFHLKQKHTKRILKALQVLKENIENFPKTNDPNIDILEEIIKIRNNYKKIKVMLKLNDHEDQKDVKDLSF